MCLFQSSVSFFTPPSLRLSIISLSMVCCSELIFTGVTIFCCRTYFSSTSSTHLRNSLTTGVRARKVTKWHSLNEKTVIHINRTSFPNDTQFKGRCHWFIKFIIVSFIFLSHCIRFCITQSFRKFAYSKPKEQLFYLSVLSCNTVF